ncbi:MAG: hypothetical protein ABFS32_14990 [Bacteroidota bacterium]
MYRGGVLMCSLLIVLAISIAKADDRGAPNVNVNDVELILANQPVSVNTLALEKLNHSLSVLNKKHGLYKSEKDFVEYMYYFTHRKILKKYDQYASLSETLTTGSYDCLTATAVYSIFFKELGISHAIVETNYHIYILVYPDSSSEILIETTNSAFGFIDNPAEIEMLKENYRRANNELKEGQVDMDINIEHRLEGKQLIGLLYYNQSVKELNLGNWQKAEELASQALTYYPIMRIEKLLKYIDASFESASM